MNDSLVKPAIVFEDSSVVVINKSAGMEAEGIKETFFPNFFLVHRLDQRVSGLMVLAKTQKAAAVLSEQFRHRNTTKKYWAVCKNKAGLDEGKLENFLEKKGSKAFVSKNGKKAVLSYKKLQQSERYSLLEIRLETGLFHQIRVQLANMGCPIVGDLKYGYPRSSLDGSIFLHAYELGFTHPESGEAMLFTLKMPEIWGRLGLGF
jgi:23S rRNA pseudouridine1911/1915/1917 synthase